MAGWDANNDATKSPYDAGWRTTDANITWTAIPGDANSVDKYQYRDNLGVGRAFIHPQNHAIFSYPVNLEKGKAYVLTCSSAKMSGNNTRPTTFSVNSAADGTGITIGTNTQNAAKWNSHTNHTVAVVAPADGTYYVLWQTAESDGDRSLAFNFMLIQSGEALEVTFDTDGGSPAPEIQYLAKGARVVEPQVNPTKEGFEFDGWWYEEDGFPLRWNFDVAIESDVDLYAKWNSTSSIGMHSTDKGLSVLSVDHGVQVKANETAKIRIVSVVGQLIKTMTVEAGDTFVGLPAGMYIVNGIKVIVN